MNTQEPHPKARPTDAHGLSEGQRRVLELLENRGGFITLFDPTFPFPFATEGSQVDKDVQAVRELARMGLATVTVEGFRITTLGRAALHPDTDTDTDAQATVPETEGGREE